MATHNLKVSLISSALRSLINITTTEGETLGSEAYQLITEAVCASVTTQTTEVDLFCRDQTKARSNLK